MKRQRPGLRPEHLKDNEEDDSVKPRARKRTATATRFSSTGAVSPSLSSANDAALYAATSRARDLIAAGSLDFVDFLPPEIAVGVFAYLDLSELATAGQVSKSWFRLSFDNQIWRRLALQRFIYLAKKPIPSLYWSDEDAGPRVKEEVGEHAIHPPSKPSSKRQRTNWRSLYRLLDSWSRGRATVTPLDEQTTTSTTTTTTTGELERPRSRDALVCGEFVVTADEGSDRLGVWTSTGKRVEQHAEAWGRDNDEPGCVTCLACDTNSGSSGEDPTSWSIFAGYDNARYQILELNSEGKLAVVARGYLSYDSCAIRSAALHGNVLAICQDGRPVLIREGDDTTAETGDEEDNASAETGICISVFRLELRDGTLRRLVSFRSAIAGAPVDVHIGKLGAGSVFGQTTASHLSKALPPLGTGSLLIVTAAYSLPAVLGGSAIGVQRFLFERRTGAFCGSWTGSSETAYKSAVQALRFDGSRVIATFADNAIRLFDPSADMKTLVEVDRLFGHTSSPTAVRVSNLLPGKLVSGARDGTIKVWNIAKGHDLELSSSSVVTLIEPGRLASPLSSSSSSSPSCGFEGIRTLAFDHQKVVASHEGGRTNIWRFCET